MKLAATLLSIAKKIVSVLSILIIVAIASGETGGTIVSERGSDWKQAEVRKLKGTLSYDDKGIIRPIYEDVYFIDDLHGWIVGNYGAILRTADGGLSWRTSTVDPSTSFMGVFFQNLRLGWVVGGINGKGIIYVSKNSGKNWQIASIIREFDRCALHDVWFTNEKCGWAVGEFEKDGASQGIVIATRDGGNTWYTQYQGKDRVRWLHSVRFTSPMQGWAVGNHSILFTEDGGRHWAEKYYAAGNDIFGLDITMPSRIWVVGSDGFILQSNNQGATWETAKIPLLQQKIWFTGVKFISKFRGWVTGQDGVILSTNDEGHVWETENSKTSDFLRKLAATSDRIIAVGNEAAILIKDL